MGLTSTSFNVVMVAAAFIAAAATLLLWNRIPGPVPVRVLARLGLLAGGEALASAALLVTINTASGGFFASWQDLLGNPSTEGAHFAGQAGQPGLISGGQVAGIEATAVPAAPAAPAVPARPAGPTVPPGPTAPPAYGGPRTPKGPHGRGGLPIPLGAAGLAGNAGLNRPSRAPGRQASPAPAPPPSATAAVPATPASGAPSASAPGSAVPASASASAKVHQAPVAPGAPPPLPVRPQGSGTGGLGDGTSAGGRQRFSPAGYGGFVATMLTGPVSAIRAEVYVWTPPQYARKPRERFPVLELLHGVPDSPGGWMRAMHVVAQLEAAIATGKAHPYILVIPEITPFSNRSAPWDNQECSNVPGDADVATWITHDVRGMVLRHFRAIASAVGWGLMGYSTGGFCAAKLVLQYPGLYHAAVSLSGYYTPESGLLTDDRTLATHNSPLWLIGHERTPAVSLLMTASGQDRMDPPSQAQQMIQAARANRGARATELQSFVAPSGGGHNQGAWEKMLPTAFTWLSQRLAGPVPVGGALQAGR